MQHADIGTRPGSGASGGLGAGILILGGQLRAREDAIDDYFGVSQLFSSSSSTPEGQKWDLVITAEGCLDAQSAQGKLTVEIARRARRHGAAVIALAGTIGPGAEGVYDDGIAAFASILDGPRSLKDAIASTAVLLTDAAERAIRMIQMGMRMKTGGDGEEARVVEEGGSIRRISAGQVFEPVRGMKLTRWCTS